MMRRFAVKGLSRIVLALLLAACAVCPQAQARHARGGAGSSGGGTTLVFNYSSGFASAGAAMYAKNGLTLVGAGAYQVTDGTSQHETTNIWYATQLNITSFSTEFSFQNDVVGGVPGYGANFVIQNMVSSDVVTNAVIAVGTITGGSGYVNGTYNSVPLTGGSGAGATANITVSGTAVTAVTLVYNGAGYSGSDTLSASNANLGGSGSGFSVPVTTLSSGVYGLQNISDANGFGFFTYANNCQCYTYGNRFVHGLAIKWDMSGNNEYSSYLGASPQTTGLYINGGPGVDRGAVPQQDLTPTSINMYLGDIIDAVVTYDGSTLTMVETDTTTGAKARFSWPVNIPAVCNCTTAWVGLGMGNVNPVTMPPTTQTFNSWVWYSGYNSVLAAPTFSVASGQYSGTQTVSLSAPAGASIYYTTNGQEPTAASSLYSTALTVSGTEIVKAVAIEIGHTDSPVATNLYQIASSGTYPINFSGGFASHAGLINTVGVSSVSGSTLKILDGAQMEEVGGAWFIAPVTISSFTIDFTLQYSAASGSPDAGTVFVIQNQLPAADDLTAPQVPASGCGFPGPCGSSVTGGPLALGGTSGVAPPYMGWFGLGSSVGLKFDLSTNTVGLLTNGEATTASAITPTGITLASGDPLAVVLTYSGTTLTESITDTTTTTNFTTMYTVNIPSVVSAGTAFVGFVGAGGFDNDVQNVTAWTMN